MPANTPESYGDAWATGFDPEPFNPLSLFSKVGELFTGFGDYLPSFTGGSSGPAVSRSQSGGTLMQSSPFTVIGGGGGTNQLVTYGLIAAGAYVAWRLLKRL